MSTVYNPIFTDDDVFSKLCKLYKLDPVIESVDPNTLINDENASYIIQGDKFYIILIKQLINWRVVVRDQLTVYMDSTTKNDYKIIPSYLHGILFFNVDNSEKSTWFFAINDGKINFNKNFSGLDLNSNFKKLAILNRC